MRIARRSADPFLRLLTATTTLWVIGQSFINVGYVIGLLPVTGIQLPLISAGGTSTATTLLMIGMMANAARHEPEAVAALRAGRDDRMTRILRLPPPEPYSPTRVEALRDRLRSKPQPAKPPRAANKKPAGGRGGRSAGAPAADRRTARSDVKGRAGGRHHGGEQRHADQRRASTGHGRAKGRVLEGQRYG
jgi:cell division protein FtsW